MTQDEIDQALEDIEPTADDWSSVVQWPIRFGKLMHRIKADKCAEGNHGNGSLRDERGVCRHCDDGFVESMTYKTNPFLKLK